MYLIKPTIMKRDGLSEEEAVELILEAKEEMNRLVEEGNPIRAMDICKEYFGLEPDYLDDLIFNYWGSGRASPCPALYYLN